MTNPPSLVPNPGALCAPPRTERSKPSALGHADHRGHVRRPATADHCRRMLVDHAVVNLASLLILAISRSNNLTLDPGP